MKVKDSTIDQKWMAMALQCAQQASATGEVPVGAVLVRGTELISACGNAPISKIDPTAHAEILALREGAEKIANYRLPGTTLYVTLEPCIMCMGAIIHARVSRLVFGAADPKTGGAGSLYNIGRDGRLNHNLEVVGGIMATQCGQLIKEFFKARRLSPKAAG